MPAKAPLLTSLAIVQNAVYPAVVWTADFTYLGATGVTVQLYHQGVLRVQNTTAGPTVTVDTDRLATIVPPTGHQRHVEPEQFVDVQLRRLLRR